MRMPAYDEVNTEVLKIVCQVALNRILDQLVFVAPMDTDRNQVGRLFAQLCYVVGNLFFVFLTMWVSARTRSAVFASSVPFLLVFLPTFLDNLNNDTISKLLGLFPDKLLEIYQALRYFYVYDFGFTVKGALEILPVLYTVLTLALVPLMYRRFRKRAVR